MHATQARQASWSPPNMLLPDRAVASTWPKLTEMSAGHCTHGHLMQQNCLPIQPTKRLLSHDKALIGCPSPVHSGLRSSYKMATAEALLEHDANPNLPDRDCTGISLNLRLQSKAERQLQRVPLLRKLPPRAVAVILLLVVINLLIWAAVGIVLVMITAIRREVPRISTLTLYLEQRFHPALSGTAILAYTFGLRHALDADHISVGFENASVQGSVLTCLGDRFDDPSARCFRSTSCHCGHVVQSRPFHVGTS